MPEEVKKRGRPALSPEEKEAKRIAKNKRDNELKKQKGYPAQVKYREARRGTVYEFRVNIPLEKKSELEHLIDATGLSKTELFCLAIHEKFGIDLSPSKEIK